jgi:integrase
MPIKLHLRGGIWHYRGTVKGRRLRGSTGTSDKNIAQREANEAEAKAFKRHHDGPAAVLTFAQAAINYRLAGKSTRFLEPIENHWGGTLVKDITQGAIKQAAVTIYPTAGAATRNRQAIVPTVAIINHNAELGLCPPLRVKRFKIETTVKTPADLEWIEAFAAHARPHLAGLAIFMFITGARISEAINVQWDDVDMHKRTVLIRQTKIGSERVAHIPQRLFLALAKIPRKPGRGVFLYANRNACIRAWDRVIARAGIEPLSFHSCRHGFATALLRAGVDPVTVSWLGGWKSAQHVFKTYGHALKDATITDRIAGTPVTQLLDLVANKPDR